MRWLLGLLFASTVLTASPAHAFEGEVDARSIGEIAQGRIIVTVFTSAKGDVRMDMTTERVPGESTQVTYIRPASGKYDYMLDREKRQALKVLKTTVATPGTPSPPSTQPEVEIEQLGSAMIAGQVTRHLRVTDKTDGQVSEFWVSDRYPAGFWRSAFSGVAESPIGPWAPATEPRYGFKPGLIMKMLSKDELGRETGFEVTRVRPKKVSEDRFQIPEDYQVILLPDTATGSPIVERQTSHREVEPAQNELPEQEKSSP